VVRARWWAAVAVAAVALGWGGFGYLATRSTDAHDYRKTAVQSAQSAYNAVATARLAGRADLDGQMFGPYVTSMLDDSRGALSGAVRQLAGEVPPDAASGALRDQLDALLTAADAGLGRLQRATDDGDDAVRRAALGDLDPVAAGLSAFVEEHK
jgi:hypothetical protein